MELRDKDSHQGALQRSQINSNVCDLITAKDGHAKPRKNPDISVVIPNFNNSTYICRCIESLKRQTHSNFEAIIVDDGSVDDSVEKAASLIKSDCRFKIIALEENQGLPSARNVGVRHANGRYIQHLDSDDFLFDEAFERLLQVADKDDLDILGFGYQIYDHTSKNRLAIRNRTNRQKDLILFCEDPALWTFDGVWSFVFRREFVVSEQLQFNEDIQLGEDQIYLSRALPRAKRCSLLPDPLIYYRQGHGGMNSFKDWSEKKWTDFFQWSVVIARNLKDFPETYNWHFLRHFEWRVMHLVAARDIVAPDLLNDFIDAFIISYSDVDLSLVEQPRRQLGNRDFNFEKHLIPLLKAARHANREAIEHSLCKLSNRYLDGSIRLAEDLMKLGKRHDALQILTAAQCTKPSNIGIALRRIDLLLSLGRFTEAEELATHFSRNEEEPFHQLQKRLGQIHMKRGRPSEALKWFQKALKLSPGAGDLIVACCRAEIQLGHTAPAMARVQKLARMGKCGELTESLLSEIALARNDKDATVNHALKWSRMVEFDGQAQLASANLLIRASALEEAREIVRRVLKHSPENADAHRCMSAILTREGLICAAIKSARRAVELEGSNVHHHIHLSQLLIRNKDWEDAIDAARAALDIDPQHAGAHRQMSLAQGQLGLICAAIKSARRAVELEGSNVHHHIHLSQLLIRNKDWEDAIDAARAALDIDPQHAGAHRQMSVAQGQLGALDAAIRSARRAVELEGSNVHHHIHLSQLLIRNKDWEDAIDAARAALDIDSQHAGAHRQMSVALISVGDIDAAVRAARRMIAHDESVACHRAHFRAVLRLKNARDNANSLVHVGSDKGYQCFTEGKNSRVWDLASYRSARSCVFQNAWLCAYLSQEPRAHWRLAYLFALKQPKLQGPYFLQLNSIKRVYGPEKDKATLQPEHRWRDQVANIAESLTSSDCVPPLLIQRRDGEYIIIDGSHRHAAMTEIGWTHCWAIVVEWPVQIQ